MATIISADEIKKQLPNYFPAQAEFFHRESAKLADKLFTKALKENSSNHVILLNGGTASGKTEFLSTHLSAENCIVFDATLATELGAENKLRQINKAGKKAIIYAVIPDDLRRAFKAFLNRDRKFSDTHFYKTHAGSRRTLLWLAKSYPNIAMNIIESSYTPSQMLQFARIEFNQKQKLINYLARLQMTESDIITYVNFLSK